MSKFNWRLWRQKRKAAGLCLHCSQRAVKGEVCCQNCLDKMAQRMRELRQKRRAAGLCQQWEELCWQR